LESQAKHDCQYPEVASTADSGCFSTVSVIRRRQRYISKRRPDRRTAAVRAAGCLSEKRPQQDQIEDFRDQPRTENPPNDAQEFYRQPRFAVLAENNAGRADCRHADRPRDCQQCRADPKHRPVARCFGINPMIRQTTAANNNPPSVQLGIVAPRGQTSKRNRHR